MQAIVRFADPADRDEFIARGQAALAAFAACPGFVGGELARSTDEPSTWVLCTRWTNVGSYRRSLSAYDVKLHATPFLYGAFDEVSGFEPVVAADESGVWRITSDLADDAAATGIGDFGTRSRRERS